MLEILIKPCENCNFCSPSSPGAAQQPPPKKKDEASIAVVALTPTRRHGNIASICVLLAALVVFAVGILGGIYLYNRLAHRVSYSHIC